MSVFVVVLQKRTSYNKKTKSEVENERSQNKDKKGDYDPILHHTQIFFCGQLF